MTEIKILIVEDERIVAMSIKDMLNNLGYGVSGIVSSGIEAINKTGETQPDLVLMDIKLGGGMDGIEAAQRIRTRFNIPVVFITAYADETTLKRAKLTEPFGYIIKPFEERVLHTAIEVALYKSKMEKKLKSREQWVTTVLKSIGDGVIAIDREGLVTFMNSAAEFLTGWKYNEALGKDLIERLNLEIKDDSSSLSKKQDRDENNKAYTQLAQQAVLISEQKKETPVEFSVAAITDDMGNIHGDVLVLRDITEKKRAEEKLKKSWIKLQKTMESSIQAISSIAEMRDPYTAGHQKRVTQLTGAIARTMKLSKDQLEGIRTASLIHDLGKIFVPAEILNKPGKLTEIEFSLIKSHPKIGSDIIETIEFPWPVGKIILQHHERLDGSGYPRGLKGSEIILEARILAVADVVEAMASHRPYRPALGIDVALKEVSQNKGTLYDPQVVEACVELFKKEGFKFK